MKKNFYLFFVFAFFIGGMMSCNDDDEPQGIIYEDTTFAHLVLDYPVTIITSATNYEAAQVTVDLDAIADKLGITREELLLSIADSIDEPDVICYGASANKTIVSSAENTDGQWGHWWDSNGENIDWGDSAMVYAQFLVEDEYFTVGQYPGHLKAGQVIEFYECVKYNDIRVACHFIFTVEDPAPVEAEIVATQNLTMSMPARATYDMDSIEFNLSQTYTDLGISAMDGVTLVGVNADGTFSDQGTAGETGFWMDKSGFVSSWGAGGVTYSSYDITASGSYIYIGQFPDTLVSGETVTAKLGFLVDTKIEMINITINITDPVELVATVVDTQKLTITVDTLGGYATDSLEFDVTQTLSDLGISSMSEIKSVVTFDTDGSLTDVTADGNVFWYDLDGNYGAWGASASLYVNYGEYSDNEISIGQYPDNLATLIGNTYTVYYGFMANEKVEMLEIAVTVTAAP